MVAPQQIAGFDRHRKHVIGAGDDINDTFVHERLSLSRVLVGHTGPAQSCARNALQVGHVVTVDLVEGGVPLIVDVAAVGDPVAGGQRDELVA